MIATTTLNRIQELSLPYPSGWKKLLQSLGKTEADDEPLTLLYILESNGINNAIWALCGVDECPEIRLFAVRCVRQVQHLLTDPRSLNALDVAELYAIGEASDKELDAAWAAAGDAARAAKNSGEWTTAQDVALDAAQAAADAEAWYAARTTAQDAAVAAAWGAAGSMARDAAQAAQELDFRDIFCTDDTLP